MKYARKVEQLKEIVIESDESEEFFSRLESSFGMDYEQIGISNGMSLEDLIQSVVIKLDRRTSEGCTAQSVFYRVRRLLVKELGLERTTILPTSRLTKILPKTSRRQTIGRLEHELKVRIGYFQAPGWIQFGTVVMLLISFVWLFINPLIGAAGIAIALSAITIANKVSSSLPFETLGELVDRIWIDNLVALQRDSGTINENEVRKVLTNILYDLHGMEKSEIDIKHRLVFA